VEADLYIALVTPFSWSTPSAVNQHVADVARSLKALGHRPVVVTSSDEAQEAARTRALFQRSRGQVVTLLGEYRAGAEPDRLLLPSADIGPLAPEDHVPVVPVGYSFPVRLSGAVANLGLPVDVTSRLEKLMFGADFDLVHVHEPLAPSLSFTALREARSPVVGTFHLTPVGAAAYALGQSVLDRFLLRLDARFVTFGRGAQMMAELYPGDYEVLSCGTSVGGDPPAPVPENAVVPPREPFGLYVYRGDGRRSYRALLRTLANGFPSDLDRVVVALHRTSVRHWVPRTLPRKLRTQVALFEFDDVAELAPLYRAASVAILPYLGGEWLCAAIAEAAVCGCPVLGPDLPPVRDYLESGEEDRAPVAGAVFSPGETASLGRCVAAVLEARPGQATRDADVYGTTSVTRRLEQAYRETLVTTRGRKGAEARTPAASYSLHLRGIGEESARRRLRHAAVGPGRSDWINADLHVHTEFSKDCSSSVEDILATAREIGLGALAIADHNEIEGAFRARELAKGDPFVIVAEEVKTAEGEVIGLFLNEAIPKGLSFDETLSLIKGQGGLVYVPHPFDALRTTPSYRAMVDNLHRIDVIEIYNAKVALSSFNLSAERFAAKYNVVAGAGSDAHVLQGLGTAMLRMPRFSDQTSFMAALWEADIIARRKNLLYLQSLKLLQTTLDRVLPED